MAQVKPTKQRKTEEQDSLLDIFGQFWQSYKINTPMRLKIIDTFVIYCMMLTIIQLGYFVIVGDFPRNSLLSGLFAPVGSFTITLCLRKQMNPETRYMKISDERTFWEYFVCMLVLFLTVVNFVG